MKGNTRKLSVCARSPSGNGAVPVPSLSEPTFHASVSNGILTGLQKTSFPEPSSSFYTMCTSSTPRFHCTALTDCIGDFFIPAFSCPFPVSRIGVVGDGGKWVCGFDRVIHQRDCVVYSSGECLSVHFCMSSYVRYVHISGVAQESSFEKVILERSATCKIYGYDFSVENVRPP